MIEPDQSLSSFNVTVLFVTVTFLLLLNVTVKLAGRLPSWFPASSQTFTTSAVIVAGVWEFVNEVIVPFLAVLVNS